MNKVDQFNQKQLKEIPEIKPGYTVRVDLKIKEGDKERIQSFEGLVIAKKHGNGINGTITVRKVSRGTSIERVFPIHSPVIDKIEVTKKSKVRRSKLYYIRDKSAKESRLKEKEELKKVQEESKKEGTQPEPEKPQKETEEKKTEEEVKTEESQEDKEEEQPAEEPQEEVKEEQPAEDKKEEK